MHHRTIALGLTGFALLAAASFATGCNNKAKAAIEACDKATESLTAAGLEACYDGCKEFYDSDNAEAGIQLCDSFDARLNAACHDDKRKAECDKYCPLRLSGKPGPKYKTSANSMCAMMGYGTIEGELATAKPLAVANPDMDPRVIEPCIGECGGRSGADPSGAEYKQCFAACKIKKAAELNAQ